MTDADTTPLILQNIQDGIADIRDQLRAMNARMDSFEARAEANDARWRTFEAEQMAWRRRLDRDEARRDGNARQIRELFDLLIDKARALDARVTAVEQA